MLLFLYRLAAHFKVWNVEELARSITIKQVQQWLAFHRIEPIGLDWLRTAKSTVLIAKAFGCDLSPEAVEMFLPTYNPDREMTEDEMQAELMKIPGARFEPNPETED
jgi:hypothetical protein